MKDSLAKLRSFGTTIFAWVDSSHCLLFFDHHLLKYFSWLGCFWHWTDAHQVGRLTVGGFAFAISLVAGNMFYNSEIQNAFCISHFLSWQKISRISFFGQFENIVLDTATCTGGPRSGPWMQFWLGSVVDALLVSCRQIWRLRWRSLL